MILHFVLETMFMCDFKDVHDIGTILSDEDSFVWFKCQGDQRSPGIIPLAVKDAFSIIQEVLFRMLLSRIPWPKC